MDLINLLSSDEETCTAGGVQSPARPHGRRVMHCHFVFAIKRKADGSIDKFKARLVADGNTQKHGVDFNRVFATVVKALTIRLVLAIAASASCGAAFMDSSGQGESGDYFSPPSLCPGDSFALPSTCASIPTSLATFSCGS